MYYSVNDYLKNKYGRKMYKLALDGAMSCPNRDGALGTRGCIFCGEAGAGEFSVSAEGDIFAQIEKAKKIVAAKAKNAGYIAYFQSYTNTYGPLEKLEELFFSAASHPEIAALSIATRPDCLPDEVMELLARLNKIKPVWVELGLQTIHPATAEYIRRGYPLEIFDEAVRKLRAAGLEVVVHLILGLPGETPEMMLESARYVGRSGAEGVKFHLLHILEGTDLAADYRAGKFETLSLEEYIYILEGCLRRIPKEMVVHRVTGDGWKKTLIAPLWSGNKKKVLNSIRRAFEKDGLIQGELF